MAAAHAKRVTLEERHDFIGIVSSTRKTLRDIRPVLSRNTGPALSTFNDKVRATPRTDFSFSSETRIAEARSRRTAHWTGINTAVGETDQGTRQNAAMVERTTAAVHSLRSEAATLAGGVSAFVLDGAPRKRTPAMGARQPVYATASATAVTPEAADWEKF